MAGLKRNVLNGIQVAVVFVTALAAGLPQIEGTSNATDFGIIFAGVVLDAVLIAVNRNNTTPINDPAVPKGTAVRTYDPYH